MGYILPDIYERVCYYNKVEMPRIFIETGTFKGGIPHRILDMNASVLDERFDEYHTIELDPDICAIASQRYISFENYGADITYAQMHSDEPDHNWSGCGVYFGGRLKLYQGDSVEKLREILDKIDEPCCFWLDAHSGAAKYAKGDKDVPLFDELDVIKEHKIKNHVIAIDDIHLFGTKQYHKKTGELLCDYTDVTYSKVHDRIKNINSKYDIAAYAPYEMRMLLACVIGD